MTDLSLPGLEPVRPASGSVAIHPELPPEKAFENLAVLARQFCRTPIATIGFLEGDREHCQAAAGWPALDVPREASFCVPALEQRALISVADTAADGRFAAHPWVNGGPRVRFCAAAPIITRDGQAIGALCVLDTKPRDLTQDQRRALQALADQAAALAGLQRAFDQLAKEVQRALKADRGTEPATISPAASSGEFADADLLDLITHNTTELICVCDLEARYVYSSASMRTVLGHDPQALLGRRLLDFAHEADAPRLEESLRALAEHKTITLTWRHRHANGAWLWLEAEARLFERQGRRFILTVGRDVTARRDLEMELRQSRERFQRIFQASPVSIGIVAVADERFIDVNQSYERMVGYSREELLGRTVGELRIEVDPQERQPFVSAIEATGSVRHHKSRLRTRKGDIRDVLVSVEPIQLGLEPCVIFIANDITELTRAEEQLRKKEASLIEAQRIGHVGSWESDLINDALEWSDETFRIFGHDPTQHTPTSQGFYDAVHPEDREQVRQVAEDARLGRAPYRIDHRIVRPDGSERIVHEEAEVVFDRLGQAVRLIGTVQDITEQRRLEAQFRQAQKMESIGRLAGGIAHDFNNILTVIQGHGSLLAAEKRSRDEAESVQQIVLAAERAANLTRQLLTFSRQQIMQPRVLDLNDVVSKMNRMLQRILGEDITLDVRYGSGLPSVRADTGMIEQVVMNLAVNSRDAMPKGGRLAVETELVTIDRSYALQNPEASEGRHIRLTVRDTGCGIPASNLPRIFEPFFTTKDVGKGTGLGLATVYGIIRQHQGWLAVESQVNQGTSFHIFLPACADSSQDEEGCFEELIFGGDETILVVEDEGPLRQLVRAILERHGYRVHVAESGPDALGVWAQHSREIQLLLTDVVMPGGINGAELASRLQATKPELKVVYTSGYSTDVIGGDYVLKPGINYLQKPYQPAKLAKLVRDCLDRED